ncbi:hypothetical protein [Cecembia calidifontis]|jgi:hypothetical protein|uniref:DNA polymerase III psi subunit n=1 Tax=Cecembia calidifontis TaxID=1187080 RepID=A0A4Q7PD05_9BACT|nr:hypothetical protein [Cecembia calidifontis]RZS98224.1 hypothetical protein BC751_3864 [Cecembia calidifontis]
MENHSIHDLALFLDTDLYVLPEERKQLIQNLEKQPALSVKNTVQEVEIREEEESISMEFEGGFEKGVLIAYEGQTLSPHLSELLFKILNAVGCSLKDIALLSSPQIEGTNMEIIQALGPEKVIVFGNLKHDLMASKRKNYEIQILEGVEYLFADELNAIHDDKNLKISLWTQLQALFNISKK